MTAVLLRVSHVIFCERFWHMWRSGDKFSCKWVWPGTITKPYTPQVTECEA